MNVGDVMDQLGEALDTIDGLRVYDFPTEAITPPAAVLAYPESIAFDETYGHGMDKLTLPVLVMVGRVSERSARDQLTPYADGSGALSVKAAVEGYTYTAADDVHVTSADFDVVRIAGVDYAAALFTVQVAGPGA